MNNKSLVERLPVLTMPPRVLTSIAALLALSLAGCSADLKQADGNKDYVKTPALSKIAVPQGLILPLQSSRYDIPTVNGPVDKTQNDVDIRPPAQFLSLLENSQSKVNGDTVSMILNNQQLDNSLWTRVVALLKEKAYPIEQQDQNQSLTTGWIGGTRLGEAEKSRARYQISSTANPNQQILSVKLVDLQQQQKTVTDPLERQRYAMDMLNNLVISLDEQINGKTTATKASAAATSWQLQSGTDDTGLPAIIVRNSYDKVWQALPSALNSLGFKVSKQDKDKGTMKVDYQGDSLSALAKGSYQVKVSDLDNRSSVQFLDKTDQVVSQSVNDELLSVLQSALNKLPAN